MAAPKFLQLVSGIPTTITATETSASEQIVSTTSAGTLDTTLFPAGFGVDTVSATATEAISAGAFVNLYLSAGILSVRNADNTSDGKRANGFALSAISNTAVGTITMRGQCTGLSALTIGTLYYLGTAGASTVTPPSSTGNVVQLLGVAIATTIIDFMGDYNVIIA